ncbi:MAG: sce7726 family protein [Sphingomonas pseudosanguinis]|uniref:sce7726 family protein n=1 Tax=Sphingomonas pseudosanguinis TaxID=413712 RepID=UPI00391DA8C8
MSAAVGRRLAEPRAKVALIEYLRRSGVLAKTCALTSELIVNKQASRADLAVISDTVHCYEIKTERDTLVRLDKQIESYSMHADYVSVLLASRHIDAAMARLPDHVGILELIDGGDAPRVTKIREASASQNTDPIAMLSYLPVTEILERIAPNIKVRRRQQVVALVASLDQELIKNSVINFLRDRYRGTTVEFLRATRRRSISISDLQRLRIWRTSERASLSQCAEHSIVVNNDVETYLHVGQSFGPVPNDIQALLAC